MALPSIVLWSKFGKESKGVMFPCILSVMLELFMVALAILLTMIFEYSCRYIVLRSMGVIGAVKSATSLIRGFFKETVLAWFTVFLVSLLGTLAMAVVVATITGPLNSLFKYIYDHHNALLLATGMLATIIAWLIVVAVSGFFAVTANAVWTISFLEFESVPAG
jgi:hypothetical protein